MKGPNNTVLITGGGTGIGACLAETFAREGNQVIICGRRQNRLKEIKKRNPGIAIKVCDVSHERSRLALVKWLLTEYIQLNVVINNAGIQRPIDLLKGSRDLSRGDEEIAINLTAPIHLSALLIPHLRRKHEAAIINITSGLAFTPLASVPVYCATKAALHSFSLSLRYQLRDTAVRVFEVVPPLTKSELHGRRRLPAGSQFMPAETVAASTFEAFISDQYEIALGPAARFRENREQFFPIMNK